MSDVIIVKNLTKSFNGFVAVNKISFSVKEGEIFGFLGPNGAGKTTTINMLATLLNPSSGESTINGFDISSMRDEVRRSIGIVFQDPALDDQLTGRENLVFHSMLYGLDKNSMNKKIDEVLKLVDLADKADIIVRKYSGGMKRRLEIARGLIHNPKVLFLDEPTLGLDAQTRRHIWDYIKDLNKTKKMTIMLTTHYMEEADYLCDRVAIIDKGEIITKGSPSSLKNSLGGDVITLELKKGDKFVKNCLKHRWIKKISQHNGSVTLTVTKAETKIPKLIDLARDCGVSIQSVNLRKPSLEDVFLHYTGKVMRDDEASSTDILRQRFKHRFGGGRHG